jgi:iron complex transport system permease protein
MGKNKKYLPQGTVLALLGAALVIIMIGSVTLGRYPIGFREMCGILGSKVVDVEPFWKPVQESLLLNHRLPRILLACLVGCCLSAAGAAYQGVFQNPMAAPDILGASSGAAFGAALAILLGCTSWGITLLAFASSLITVCLVMLVSKYATGDKVLGLILGGIIIEARGHRRDASVRTHLVNIRKTLSSSYVGGDE